MARTILQDQEVYNNFYAKAARIGEIMKAWHNTDFVHAWFPRFKISHPTGDSMKVKLNRWVYVEFFDINIIDGQDYSFGPQQPVGQPTAFADFSRRVPNYSDLPVDYKSTLATGTQKRELEKADVRVSVTNKFSLQAGSEALGVKATNDFTINVAAGFSKEWERKNTTTLSGEVKMVIPPKTAITIEEVREKGNYRREFTARGKIEAKVRVHSDGDLTWEWASLEELHTVYTGKCRDSRVKLADHFRNRGNALAANSVAVILPYETEATGTIEYPQKTSGNIVITQEKL